MEKHVTGYIIVNWRREKMKRWIKKHSKILVVVIGLVFLGNSIWGIVASPIEWKIAVHSIAIALWLLILFFYTGATEKLYNWWEKD